MNLVIDRIFKEKGFLKGNSQKGIAFFYRDNSPEREFFFVQTVDASGKEGAQLRQELVMLENEFSQDFQDNLKNFFLNQVSDENKIQFDKNLSLIILVKIESFVNLSTFKNHIYAIEESPRFFKKNVLIYTERQVQELRDCLSASEKSVEDVLNEEVNSLEGYFKVYRNENYDGLYSLVVRLFAKIPFLKYAFSEPISILSLEKRIADGLKDNRTLTKLYGEMDKLMASDRGENDIGEFLFKAISDSYVVSGNEIQRELANLIGENNEL